jgi:flavin reductase (DIM6/NTAB) family NADH-FMN oxidoreductase RutF
MNNFFIKAINGHMVKTISAQMLKKVAGGFATGVTVVCIEDDDGNVKGMTANSFVSISLLPPIVMFSVRNEADIMQYLEVGKNVGISILSEGQKWLSDQFAGLTEYERPVSFISKDKNHVVDGALAWYETTVDQILPAGDHQLILCAVDDLGRDENARPLIYYSGYNGLGDVI